MSARERDRRVSTVGNYNFGAVIGKGGVGTVYQGLDVENGDFVAVKQINLQIIPKLQLNEIMQEIDLLKNLNHPNIVKYIKYEKTDDYLYIVLEYIENGSLSSIVKKFGKFPEPLVCVYITQVLEGLVYLHEQGVVHRDIKGANILTTKEGVIKLADFGLATKTSEVSEVAGTPYWMAPEIIEMQGASTASDIWSVGCTVIELLTGNPPYSEFHNMSALYHIVQDDYPPLPEGISPALREWLMECFQKDPALRISAQKLLKHRWIQSGKRRENIVTDPINVARKIQDYNTKLKQHAEDQVGTLPKIKNRKVSPPPRLLPPPESVSDEWSDDFAYPPTDSQTTGNSKDGEIAESAPCLGKKGKEASLISLKGLLRKTMIVDVADIFGDGTPPTPPQTRSQPLIPSSSLLSKSPPPVDIVLVPTRAVGMTPVVPIPNFVPNSTPNLNSSTNSAFASPPSQPTNGLTSSWPIGELSPPSTPPPTHQPSLSNTSTISNSSTSPITHPHSVEKKFSKLLKLKLPERTSIIENNNNNIRASNNGNGIDLASRLYRKFHKKGGSVKMTSPRSPRSTGATGDVDIFDEFEDQLDVEVDLDATVVKDQLSKMTEKIIKLMTKLQPNQSEELLLTTCQELIEIFRDNPGFKRQLIHRRGVIPIMEMLEVSNPRVIHSILQVVNQIIEYNEEIHENLCLVGGIPSIMRFSGSSYTLPIRLECARFISTMCSTSILTLQMVIACRGLPVLVDMLSTCYDESKVLVFMAIDAILSVFELQTTTPKKDFCRLFAKSGLLKIIVNVLRCTTDDHEAKEKKYPEKISNILLLFSSAEDGVVKIMMSHEEVLSNLFRTFEGLPSTALVKILKCIKQLASDHNTRPSMLKAGAIHHLIEVLDLQQVEHASHMQMYVLGSLQHLCHLDAHAQLQAVEKGIIPHLQSIIKNPPKQSNPFKQQQADPLKQQALPMLFDLAHVPTIYEHLWENNCAEFYLDMLCEEYWEGYAMDSLSAWLKESPKLEEIILQPANMSKIIEGFKSAKNISFTKFVGALVRGMFLSVALAKALSISLLFVRLLLERLQHPDPHVRLNLLKVLKMLFENHPHPQKMVDEYRLVPIVKKFTQDKVLVKNLASRLLIAMGEPLSPVLARHSRKSSLIGKKA